MVKYLLMLKSCFLRFDFIADAMYYTIHPYVSHRTQYPGLIRPVAKSRICTQASPPSPTEDPGTVIKPEAVHWILARTVRSRAPAPCEEGWVRGREGVVPFSRA